MENTFKVGDKVRRIKDAFCDMKTGDTDIITFIRLNALDLRKYGCGHASYNFELVEPTLQDLIEEKEALLAKIEGELAEARALLAEVKGGDRYKGASGILYEVLAVEGQRAWVRSNRDKSFQYATFYTSQFGDKNYVKQLS